MRIVYRATAVLALPAAFFLLLGAGACNHTAREKNTADTVLFFPAEDEAHADIKRLQDAILKGDAPAFAGMVSYPLARPYPLHDISDSVQMVKYFSTLIDDSLRHHVRKLSPAAWEPVGWRGWAMPGSGEYDTDLWFDGTVYDVPYVSRRERYLADSLRNVEMQTLPESMRSGGWQPAACLHAENGIVYRIDVHKSHTDTLEYRLSEYKLPLRPRTAPIRVFDKGYVDMEGSAGNKFYRFRNAKGMIAEYDAEPSDGSAPSMIFINQGDTIQYGVLPSYWLDYLKK